MKVIVASDEKTYLTDFVIDYPKWVEIGKEAAEKVANGKVKQGILFCWSGTGVCMAANRVKGVRAALCWDTETARLARKWDNANILCMNLRYTSVEAAKEILDVWFSTEFDEEGLNETHKLESLF